MIASCELTTGAKKLLKTNDGGIHWNKVYENSDTAIFLENSDINGWYKAIKRLTESEQMRIDYAEKLKEYTNINYNLNTWTEIRKKDLVLELA